MMGKTHIAVGLASSYLLLQPSTPPQFAAATVGGCIGSIMADIDVKIDRSNKYALRASLDALYGEILAVGISIAALASNYLSGGTIIQAALAHWQQSLIGVAFLIVLIAIGEASTHRDRTHSLLAMLLFSFSVLLIDKSIGIAFAVGYASHLIIDLFNKSPIRILYPLKKGFCLKVCYADRFGNELLLVTGTCIIILYVFLHQ